MGVYNLSRRTLVHQWQGHAKGVNRVAYLPTSSLAVRFPVYFQCLGLIWKLFSLSTICRSVCSVLLGRCCQDRLTCHSQSLQVSGSRDTTVRVWSRAASEAVAILSAHTLPVTGLAPLDHHNQICSGSRDCTLRLWDVATRSEVACSTTPQNLVTFMTAVPSEAAVLQTGEDLQLRLRDTRCMQYVQMLTQHNNIPLCCDVSPDGE